jgi:NADH:ubiquinone oxidoreductase subunit
VTRGVLAGADKKDDGTWSLGASREQARERTIVASRSVRFRKVVGYQFVADAGAIAPQWSDWITYRVNARRQLVRVSGNGQPRVVANHVDAFDLEAKADGTIVATMVTARRDPTGAGWRRYANSVTIHPKN